MLGLKGQEILEVLTLKIVELNHGKCSKSRENGFRQPNFWLFRNKEKYTFALEHLEHLELFCVSEPDFRRNGFEAGNRI